MTADATELERFEQAVLERVHEDHGLAYTCWVEDLIDADDGRTPVDVAREEAVEPVPENAGAVASAYRARGEGPQREAVNDIKRVLAEQGVA